MSTESKTVLSRIKETYFKDVPASEMMAEVKKLTIKDREDFCRWFNDIGLPTTMSA